MPLTLEALQAVVAQHVQESAADEASSAGGESRGTEAKTRPVRRQRLPEHFDRDENVIEPAESACTECGGELMKLGEPDASEVLEAKTVTFTVTRHIRPKKRCCKCARIVQRPGRQWAGATRRRSRLRPIL